MSLAREFSFSLLATPETVKTAYLISRMTSLVLVGFRLVPLDSSFGPPWT